MKLAAPIILLIHWFGIFIYYTVMKVYPSQYNIYGWSVFYFSINNLTIINYCLLFVFTKASYSDKQFVLVDVLFTLVLGFTIIADYKQLIAHTYGFYISILGMIISTMLVVINGVKYGIFKSEYENE